MSGNTGQRLRDLEQVDRRLRELDYELGDWFRRQTVKIRETREAVADMKDLARKEMKGGAPE